MPVHPLKLAMECTPDEMAVMWSDVSDCVILKQRQTKASAYVP